MSKYQCLNCQHLDIEYPNKAICTGSYEAEAIPNSLYNYKCPYYMKQENI